MNRTIHHVAIAIVLTALVGAVAWAAPEQTERSSFIVRGDSVKQAEQVVLDAGGEVTHRLAVIDAVGAKLTVAERKVVEAHPRIRRVFADRNVETSDDDDDDDVVDDDEVDDDEVDDDDGDDDDRDWGGATPTELQHVGSDDFVKQIGADRVRNEQRIEGDNIAIAFIDTGISPESGLRNNSVRKVTYYDAINQRESAPVADGSGHGTHLASLAAGNISTDGLKLKGVAPNADLVSVIAFDANGQGSYADVIHGIDWVLQNKTRLNIRVLNCSFSSPPQSHYWDDPLNLAIMRVWQEGIVVVASAGNRGPDPMTIGVPGNVPYVITVGATTDNYTPNNPADDRLATFSSAGPTVEGFIKPEVVAPGGHIMAQLPLMAMIRTDSKTYFGSESSVRLHAMSGTSQSAAVVSGVVALMLEASPWLTPDQVKYRLMASARPAVNGQGELAYSVFQQGAGLVHAYDAVNAEPADPSAAANVGLDIYKDISGVEHYGGKANRDAAGNYYIEGLDGYMWADAYLWQDGSIFTVALQWIKDYLSHKSTTWSDAYMWQDAYLWQDGYLWADSYMWADAYLWQDAYMWQDAFTELVGINDRVRQE